MAKLQAKTDDELQALIKDAVEDAVDFIEVEIAPDRIKAQEYFDGKVDIGEEPNRSRVVATKVRDTIRQVKPSLMRIFLAHERPVEFVPKPGTPPAEAEQATRYASDQLEQADSFRLLNDAFDDALRKKTGYLKAYWDEYSKAEILSFTDLTDDELMLVLQGEGIELLEHSVGPVPGAVPAVDPMTGAPGPLPQLHDIKISRTETGGKICIESVPPEEFFVSRNSRSIETAYCHGHRAEKYVGDLVAMGFAFDEVVDLGSFEADGSDITDEERVVRRKTQTTDDDEEGKKDPSMRKVTLTEAYMRVDVDGTGIPVFHRFLLGGTKYKLLDYEPYDESPFAKFEIDPEPHAFHGRSIFDLIKNEQDASTATLRGILDNVAMVNTPRLAAVEGQVNMSDLLNNEIGAVVRMRQIDAVRDLSVPFVAGQTLPALQYLDDLVEQKTGVTRASTGLDPDALQSTTKAAVTATISAAAAQIETMARNLAEGGMTRLMKIILRLAVKHARGPEMVRSGQQYVPIDPRVWDTGMRMKVNVGLGTGREEERQMALGMTLQTQMGILQNYGPSNPLVGLTELRNTLADMLFASGVRNADRYYKPMTAEIEAQLAAQAQQAAAQAGQQPPQDPQALAYLQAEGMKTQAKSQSDMMNTQAKAAADAQRAQLQMVNMQMQDDRERDRMLQDLEIKNAEIAAKYGMAIDTARIKAQQAAPRAPGGVA